MFASTLRIVCRSAAYTLPVITTCSTVLLKVAAQAGYRLYFRVLLNATWVVRDDDDRKALDDCNASLQHGSIPDAIKKKQELLVRLSH